MSVWKIYIYVTWLWNVISFAEWWVMNMARTWNLNILLTGKLILIILKLSRKEMCWITKFFVSIEHKKENFVEGQLCGSISFPCCVGVPGSGKHNCECYDAAVCDSLVPVCELLTRLWQVSLLFDALLLFDKLGFSTKICVWNKMVYWPGQLFKIK